RCTYLLSTRRNYKLVQDKKPEPQNQDQELRCHTCSAFPRLAQRILDPRTGKAFRLYRCECGDTVWKSSPLTIVGTPRIITSFGSRRMFKQVQRILLEIPERGQVN